MSLRILLHDTVPCQCPCGCQVRIYLPLRACALCFDCDDARHSGLPDSTDEVEPMCDICGQPQTCERGEDCTVHAADWNGDTGNHLSCEATYVRAWVAGARHG